MIDREGAAIVARDLLAVLQAQPTSDTGRAGADFRRTCAAASTFAADYLYAGTMPQAIAACFGAGMAAGIGYKALGTVRAAASAYTAAPGAATAVRLLVLRLALVNEALAAGDVELRSRPEADAMLARFNAAFEPAIDDAADAGDAEVFQVLRTVHASTVRRLVNEARPLPQIVTYRIARPMPSLAIAHRLYGDASRHGEILDENRVRHPAFAPAEGRVLAR